MNHLTVDKPLSDKNTLAPAAKQACQILNLLLWGDKSFTLSEICQQLDLPVSSTHRILQSLLSEKMLDRDLQRKKAYCLSAKFIQVSSKLTHHQYNTPHFYPVAEILKNELGLSSDKVQILLSVPMGLKMVTLNALDEQHRTYIGQAQDLDVASAGCAYLAMQSRRVQQDYLASLEADVAASFLSRLKICYRLGYASAVCKDKTSTTCAILNHNNLSVATLSIQYGECIDNDRQRRDASHLIQAGKNLSTYLLYQRE